MNDNDIAIAEGVFLQAYDAAKRICNPVEFLQRNHVLMLTSANYIKAVIDYKKAKEDEMSRLEQKPKIKTGKHPKPKKK